jgi:hypothetical protein
VHAFAAARSIYYCGGLWRTISVAQTTGSGEAAAL